MSARKGIRLSIFERFDRLAASDPQTPALIDAANGRIITRGQLVHRARVVRDLLAVDSPGQGELIAVRLPNSMDFVATVLAAFERGFTVLPIDRDASEPEVARIAARFTVRFVVQPALSDEDGILPRVTTPATARTRDDIPEGVVLAKLSSGSSGLPRGVLTTEDNLVADCDQICSTMEIGAADVNLGTIPFSHSYGFSNLVMPLLLQGTAVVFSNDYAARSILEIANRWKCTVLPGIPMMFEHLSGLDAADGSFETVRTFISAGAPLTPEVARRFRARFGWPVHSFYGCSECGGIAYDRSGDAIARGRVGQAMDGVRLRVEPRTGRLVVESRAAAAGYLLAPHDEDEKFRPGTFRTDDLVHIDERGEIELRGRISDLINAAGRKINPREIERVIREIDGVREVRVYGEPAGARGEVVAAAVVADPHVTREDIRAWCRTHLSAHKVPRIVKLIDQLPVDQRGKVKRSALLTA